MENSPFCEKSHKKSSPLERSLRVFCRVRPSDFQDICLKVVSDSTVLLSPPESNLIIRNGVRKQIQYTFQKVFDNVSQQAVFQEVALPLVEDLISGRSGLIFTYGVTGSGKSYTMNGKPSELGIVPRSIDILFNSIDQFQAKKCIFKSDKMNGFEVQTESEALLDQLKEVNDKSRNRSRKYLGSSLGLFQKLDKSVKIKNINENNTYAVFITCVEIYNNYVYDLLADVSAGDTQHKASQLKLIREDAMGNMYIHGANEIEVKSAEEAFEIYQTAQRRKKICATMSNAESSRGHSVFTLRLVQAPLNVQSGQIVQDTRMLKISQLSLVDLAGVERTKGTQIENFARQRETGKINNSLLTLRTCLEVLRKNQHSENSSKVPPYRESRLTQLFRNYFEGEGCIRMIVCVNPKSEEYAETLHVMKFSEMSQEILICASPLKPAWDRRCTPRRQAKNVCRSALKEIGNKSQNTSDLVDAGHVYSCRLGPEFPSLELTDPADNGLLKKLASFLEERYYHRNELLYEVNDKYHTFRMQFLEREKDGILVDQENQSLKTLINCEKKKIEGMRYRTVDYDSKICKLKKIKDDWQKKLKALVQDQNELEMRIQRVEEGKMRRKQDLACRTKFLLSELELEIKEEKKNLESNMKEKEKQAKRARRALGKEELAKISSDFFKGSRVKSVDRICTKLRRHSLESVFSCNSDSEVPKMRNYESRKVESSKDFETGSEIKKRRKSHSMDDELWCNLSLTPIIQSTSENRKSNFCLTVVKDIIDSGLNNNQDNEEKLEHKYQEDVIYSADQGAWPVTPIVRALKQTSLGFTTV